MQLTSQEDFRDENLGNIEIQKVFKEENVYNAGCESYNERV